jgi:hypothetical protein
MKTTKLALAPVLALLAVALASRELCAQTGTIDPNHDPLIEAAAVKYDAAHWPAGARRAGCDLGALTLSGLEGKACERDDLAVTRRFADAQGRDVVLIEMAVADTVDAAHAKLLRHVAFVQSTKTLPTATSRGITAGDVGFIGFGGKEQDRIAWLAFVAGNVEFRLVSLNPAATVQPDLRDAAARLTALVAKSDAVPAGTPLPAPSIERFNADPVGCAPGESVRLDVTVKDPTGAKAALDFDVAGTAQGYVEDDENGLTRFHATKAGQARVTLFALGVNGVVAQKQVTIEVAAKKQ